MPEIHKYPAIQYFMIGDISGYIIARTCKWFKEAYLIFKRLYCIEIYSLTTFLAIHSKFKRRAERYNLGRVTVKWKWQSGLCGSIPELPPKKPSWCICGVCRPMPDEQENKCCGKITCVTSFVTFRNVCTDRDVLVMAIRARCDIRADEMDYSMNSFRKAAYRQYILWRYKNLGRGTRKVCPSRVVLAITQGYPAEDGQYMGFRRA